ncbi:MAG: hypoxanthine phosphoribosyltransferase [Chloroflexi bacterium]|nr:hypoxanthine phosphoribosyltransferase [Chloroflexota bacterium]
MLIDAPAIEARVADLGAAISRDYAGTIPLLVGVLRGCIVLMADLLRQITIPVNLDFIAISSYGPTTRSSGVVRIQKDLETSIEGRHVLLIEDIVDTGLTLGYTLRMLRSRKPASLAVGTLLDKPARRLVDIDLKYRCFEIPDKFVVGYGLDFDQLYRNLPFICVLRPELYS